MRSARHAAFALAAALPLALIALACGTDAIGIETCRQVEEARCAQAPACGISLEKPLHRDAPARDVESCIRHYRDACLHGLASNNDPGAVAVKSCVDLLKTTSDCAVIRDPEKSPECAWLKPAPPPVPTVAPEAEAGTSDAGDG